MHSPLSPGSQGLLQPLPSPYPLSWSFCPTGFLSACPFLLSVSALSPRESAVPKCKQRALSVCGAGGAAERPGWSPPRKPSRKGGFPGQGWAAGVLFRMSGSGAGGRETAVLPLLCSPALLPHLIRSLLSLHSLLHSFPPCLVCSLSPLPFPFPSFALRAARRRRSERVAGNRCSGSRVGRKPNPTGRAALLTGHRYILRARALLPEPGQLRGAFVVINQLPWPEQPRRRHLSWIHIETQS